MTQKRKCGRPTQDPKKSRAYVRLTAGEREKLDFTAEKLGIQKSAVLLRGLDIMYQTAKEKE